LLDDDDDDDDDAYDDDDDDDDDEKACPIVAADQDRMEHWEYFVAPNFEPGYGIDVDKDA
jgi:hypothetical protein